MRQNLIDLNLEPSQWEAIDQTITTLEEQFQGLVSFSPEGRRRFIKMGKKSEAFCRQAVDMAREHTGILTRQFDLDSFQGDLATLDTLRPRVLRVMKLHERLADSQMALGSDLMKGALECYAILKVAGNSEGLEGLRQSLAQRFKRRKGAAEAAPVVLAEQAGNEERAAMRG